MIDKNGTHLWPDDRVMIEGSLTGTVTARDDAKGELKIAVDGEDREVVIQCKPLCWGTEEVESLGDGVNQAMRAAQGQPH